MEGIANEACSLAGHWGLGKLIAFYDDNHISIDGDTEIAFTEDVSTCFDALGWHTIWVKNGNTGYDDIRAAIKGLFGFISIHVDWRGLGGFKSIEVKMSTKIFQSRPIHMA
jgi:hypothetical protein